MVKNGGFRVAVIVPAYNEGAVIYDVINNLQAHLNNKGIDFRIIVVDDGSSDTTAAEAKRAGAHVVSHIINMGTGGATATGMAYARQNNFEIAVTVDADGQHSPEDVAKGIDHLVANSTDLLIGSRLYDTKGMSVLKVVGNRGLSTVTRIIFGVRVADSQSGLRLFSKKAIDQLQWRTNGYEFCSEMLWRARQQGLSIGEYPITVIYSDYSKSKGQSNWNGVNILKALLSRRIMELFGE